MYNPAKDENGLPKRGKQFDAVKLNDIQRNKFNMSYAKRGSYNFNYLYPVDIQEVLPGDTWNLKRSAIAKAAPLKAPIYHRCNVYFHSYYVSSRLLWSNYKKMRSLGDGTQSLVQAESYEAPTVPSKTMSYIRSYMNWDDITTANISTNTRIRLLTEMGISAPLSYSDNGGNLDVTVDSSMWDSEQEVSMLPLRAYYLIWYEYYRDQNNYQAVEPQLTDTVSADEFIRICQLRQRAWEHDYFTSSLLTPQRGPAVTFGFNSASFDGNISFNSISFNGASADSLAVFTRDLTNGRRKLGYSTELGYGSLNGVDAAITNDNLYIETGGNINEVGNSQVEHTGLSGSLDGANFDVLGGAVTLETLRQAARLQEFLESMARCGSRYTEFLLYTFGVVSSDARLQRPEYIAGGSMPLSIGSVVNQSDSDTGSYSGIASASSGDLDKFSYYCEEDGYIITLMSIMPTTSYSQGLPRMWTRLTTFDFCIPKFAQLGEQEVKMKEIYFSGNDEANELTFGYQARYQDYKYNPDRVAGEFLTNLSYWTLSRYFSGVPYLNYSFIHSDGLAPYRCFQVTDETVDHFYVDFWNDWIVERKLPEFNVPKL